MLKVLTTTEGETKTTITIPIGRPAGVQVIEEERRGNTKQIDNIRIRSTRTQSTAHLWTRIF